MTVRTPLPRSAFLVTGFYGDATVFLNKARLVACAVAIIVAVGLYLLLEYTRLGKALRAAADNPKAATYMGSTSIGPIASPSASAAASPRSPAA